MRKVRWFVFYIGMLFILIADAQSAKTTKAQKKAENTKQEQLRKEEKAEIKGRKRHEQIQTAKVRKRMRKHRKGDVHVNAYDRRPGFFKRLFHHKEHQ